MTYLSIYFKVLKKHMPQMVIYLIAFLCFLSVEVSFHKFENKSDCFRVIVQDDDQTNFSRGLVAFLKNKTELVEEEKVYHYLDEALYFGKAEYIIKIPRGFSASLQSDQSLTIEIDSVQNSKKKKQLAGIINKYCKGTMQEKIDKEAKGREGVVLNSYFNYLTYGLGSVILIGVMDTTRVLNRPQVKKRRLCALITEKQELADILVCHLIFGMMSLAGFLIAAGFIDLKCLWSFKGILWSFNSILLMVILVEAGYLFSMFASKVEHQVMITNVVTLGTSFLSGNYVKQSDMDVQVLMFSKFLPTYWYIKASNAIATLKEGEQWAVDKVGQYFYIEGVFIGVLLVIILVVIKERTELNGGLR